MSSNSVLLSVHKNSAITASNLTKLPELTALSQAQVVILDLAKDEF